MRTASCPLLPLLAHLLLQVVAGREVFGPTVGL